MAATILWFRRNLRVTDNPAVASAIDVGEPVVPVYIVDELDSGGASRWWLHHSLKRLEESLRELGSRLVLRSGDPSRIIPELVAETGARSLCYSRRYEPKARHQEALLDKLVDDGIDVRAFDDRLLHPPDSIATASGSPYKVFTPFWRASLEHGEPPRPSAAPTAIRGWSGVLKTQRLDDLGLAPVAPDWAAGFRISWKPGEDGALAQLDRAAGLATHYADVRDRPDKDQTSRLSPHLHFGEVSPAQVWHAIRATGNGAGLLRQLFWRDFSHYLLYHHPTLPEQPLREEFEHFPWRDDPDALSAWQQGRTGYPLVDAGMRQLWETGWMHNRVRMVAASFLVKNLLIPWQRGADWFLDTLVDADLANNSASWQWVAGCGTDAAPYFRIFNPETQRSKFDPHDAYARRWIPELDSGDYPKPIVDLASSRRAALDAYQSTRDLLRLRAG